MKTVGDGLSAPRPAEGRLGFLDALRGVAVALVLAQHVGELLFPGLRDFTMVGGVQLGQMGVTVFFLCSGFIIPASLERQRRGEGPVRSLRRFWHGRFFRLFPLYWLSLAAALVLTVTGSYRPAQPMSAGDWLVNTSMMQMFAGVPNALGLYWTLAFELLFYLGLSALFLVGRHRHSVALSLAASGVCMAAAAGAELVLHRPPVTGIFYLATMITGTVFHRWHSGRVRLPWLALCVAASLASGGAQLALSSFGPVPALPRDPAAVPMLTAWVGAYAIFCAGIALRDRQVPGWLSRLGTLSYSVYLMQALVLAAVPRPATPAIAAVVWVGATLVVSEITYRFAELPAMRLGRRLSASPAPRRRTAHLRIAPVAGVAGPAVPAPVEPVASGAPAA